MKCRESYYQLLSCIHLLLDICHILQILAHLCIILERVCDFVDNTFSAYTAHRLYQARVHVSNGRALRYAKPICFDSVGPVPNFIAGL